MFETGSESSYIDCRWTIRQVLHELGKNNCNSLLPYHRCESLFVQLRLLRPANLYEIYTQFSFLVNMGPMSNNVQQQWYEQRYDVSMFKTMTTMTMSYNDKTNKQRIQQQVIEQWWFFFCFPSLLDTFKCKSWSLIRRVGKTVQEESVNGAVNC